MAVTNTVIDLSHHNGKVDFAAAKKAGIAGIIHKASQGTKSSDPLYAANRKAAKAAGLLWGAYHFGTGEDGAKQADFFLATASPAASELMVLDFESNPAGPTMTLVQARAFVTRIQSKAGRWPGFYSGHDIKEALGNKADATLAKCWFWLAQYGPTAVVPPNWKSWTFWQYTDGAVGPLPHTVAGVGPCDRDKYNGTDTGLLTFWMNGGL